MKRKRPKTAADELAEMRKTISEIEDYLREHESESKEALAAVLAKNPGKYEEAVAISASFPRAALQIKMEELHEAVAKIEANLDAREGPAGANSD